MVNRLHFYADHLQHQLLVDVGFLSRLGMVALLLPIYICLSFYDAAYLLIYPKHKSFIYFHNLHPQKGYTSSYVQHAHRQRWIRYGFLFLVVMLILQMLLLRWS
jgi:hypothetical protein